MKSFWLYSGDGDFLPLVDALVDRGVYVSIVNFNDPEQGEVAPLFRAKADHYLRLDKRIMYDSALKDEFRVWRTSYNGDAVINSPEIRKINFNGKELTLFQGMYGFQLCTKKRESSFHSFDGHSLDQLEVWWKFIGSDMAHEKFL